MKAKINLSNILAFSIGNLRYHLYYSSFRFLIRKHILEQIEFRVKYMDDECYENGSCKLCGCATIALQMANKQCDKPCYPPMVDKDIWRNFKKGNTVIKESHTKFVWRLIGNKLSRKIGVSYQIPTKQQQLYNRYVERNRNKSW